MTKSKDLTARLEDNWDKCLEIIAEKITDAQFFSWIKPVIPQEFGKKTIILEVPNAYFCEVIKKKYNKLLSETVKNVFGPNVKILYYISKHPETKKSAFEINAIPITEKKAFQNFGNSTSLDPKLTLGNFISKKSESVIKTIKTIVDRPGEPEHNPLLIIGDKGSGKTHILNAFGNEIIEKTEKKSILYLSVEEFISNFNEAFENKTINDFCFYIGNAEVLLLDDLDLLNEKEFAQQIFMHILNIFIWQDKQVVLTIKKDYPQLNQFSKNLIQKISSGKTILLQQPDHKTKIRILEKKCIEMGISIEPKVLNYLVKRFSFDVGYLENILFDIIDKLPFKNIKTHNNYSELIFNKLKEIL